MQKKIKLLDGSLSYPLEKKGYNLNKKLWTGDPLINNPNAIKKVHKDYLFSFLRGSKKCEKTSKKLSGPKWFCVFRQKKS